MCYGAIFPIIIMLDAVRRGFDNYLPTSDVIFKIDRKSVV